MKDIVLTPRGPKPIGPYSQAVKANGFVFVSGQIALDPLTGVISRRQARSADTSQANAASCISTSKRCGPA